ncbi:MAG TPA: CinA family protein, partial [Microbacterium sp.]|nr:CinA family protein [Microbacterium sp.]
SADVGIATTGVAGPASPDGQPVGTVHVGVATPDGVQSFAFRFGGDREEIRRQSVDAAISAALRTLQE